jgi:hypothetical protein
MKFSILKGSKNKWIRNCKKINSIWLIESWVEIICMKGKMFRRELHGEINRIKKSVLTVEI